MIEPNACDAVWDLLSLYADGEAGPNERDLVEKHVRFCESCMLDLQFLRETSTVLAQTPLVSPPPDLKQAILAATIYRPSWQERLRQAAANALPAPRLRLAGAALATLLVGVVLYQGARQPVSVNGASSSTDRLVKPAAPSLAANRAGDPTGARARKATAGPAAGLARASRPLAPRDETSERDEIVMTESAPRVAAVAPPVAPAVKRHAAIASPSIPRRNSGPRPLRSTLDYTRIASTLTPRPADETTLTEPTDMRDPMGAQPSAGGTTLAHNESENKTEIGAGDNKTTASPRRYTLAASLPVGGADSMATFADLRSALRKRTEPARTVSLDLTDRHAMVDVYKQRF